MFNSFIRVTALRFGVVKVGGSCVMFRAYVRTPILSSGFHMRWLRLGYILGALCAMLLSASFQIRTLASAILRERFAWKSEDRGTGGSAFLPRGLTLLTSIWTFPARFESLAETLEAGRLLF